MDQHILITRHGGPEVLEFREAHLPPPGCGEVRMRHSAIGLNFIDVGQRKGSYFLPLPSGLGVEAAGIVERIGPGVTGFAAGDRVCTFGPLPGTYATARNVPARLLFHSPADLSDEVLAASLLKGCTAEFLVERCARVEPGQPVLVHAAAGGVGLLLVQWLRHVGALVIGTVSRADKEEEALAAGCHHVIRYDQEDPATKVMELTAGEGVRVTFDGVGATTWASSLAATGRRGLIISYGIASAALDSINPGVLMLQGSLFNSRPALYDYYFTSEERAAGTARVFDLLRRGILKPVIGQRYPLYRASSAHRDMEERRTIGSGLLLP